MIIYIYGDDSYRAGKKMNEYIERYSEKYGGLLSFSKFDLSEKGKIEEIKKFFATTGMFISKKMAVVKINSKFSEDEFLDFIKSFDALESDDNFLIIYNIKEGGKKKDKKAAKISKLEKFLLDKVKTKNEFNIFKNYSEAKKWIKDEFLKRGINIEEEAMNMLFDYFGGDNWRLANEIEKLSLYKNKDKKVLKGDIYEACSLSEEIFIFDIFEAFLKRDKKKTMSLFYRAKKEGIDEREFFNLFIDQIRIATYVVLEKEKELGYIHPFRLQKIKEKLRNFSKEKILRIFNILADIDWAVKNGKIDYSGAFERLVMEL